MKKIWLELKEWDKEALTTALESGIDGVVTTPDLIKKIKELGLVQIIAPSKEADLFLGKDVVEIKIQSKADEEKVASLNKEIAIVEGTDWTIIPLENLIAQNKPIFFPVFNLEEAKVALTILEQGVTGVVIKTSDTQVIKEIAQYAKNIGNSFSLETFEILEVNKISMGDRVCIDTITNMKEGEGMLIGNYSNAFFLVHAETVQNPYVAPRPFRVNAGAVHAYVQMPSGKTCYMDELSTGDEVLIVNHKGEAFSTTIGRLKIEKRPMLNIKALAGGKEVSIVLQNAETIRLTKPDGKPISVVHLKKGDKVLGYTEEGGRHFGFKIKETIHEK